MKRFLLLVSMLVVPSTLAAYEPQDPAKRIGLQKEAMAPLDLMNGVWRGTAWTMLPSGEKHTVTHTERVGPFLDGSVKVMEGRSYNADGSVPFNAFGTISFDPSTKVYTMHSYAMGHVGDFPLTLSESGFSWEMKMGPATMRYTAVIKDGKWNEIGERIVPGKDPVRVLEMNLERVGDTDWPSSGAIPPK